MSIAVLGFALGLSAAGAADAPTMNPDILAADRQYQELVYAHKRVLRLATRGQSLVIATPGARDERADADNPHAPQGGDS